MAAGGAERISGYFRTFAFGLIISGAPYFRNPSLTKVTNQLDSTLRRSRHLFDISRTFQITVSVFHHKFRLLLGPDRMYIICC
jgi:hypothetical protein